MVKDTKAEDIIRIFEKLSEDDLGSVLEITLDMVNSMRKIANKCFSLGINNYRQTPCTKTLFRCSSENES